MDCFATTLPGFGPLFAREIEATPRLRTAGTPGFDGRNDIVGFTGPASRALLDLRTCEDVFADLASVRQAATPRDVSAALMAAPGLDQALSAWTALNRPLTGRMGYRVIVRLRSERHFLRTALRDYLVGTVARMRPRWRHVDPAPLEFWCIEDEPGHIRIGLRLSSAGMRQHGGRTVERAGALRASAAAAMVLLAGDGDDEGEGRLLDPCCGSGTLLAEAAEEGWEPYGLDIDPRAMHASRRNTGRRAALLRADARAQPFADGAFGALVSNLPFGQQYRIDGDPERWLTAVLGELLRVATRQAPLVLLLPESREWRAALRRYPRLAVAEQFPVTVLGQRTVLWRLQQG